MAQEKIQVHPPDSWKPHSIAELRYQWNDNDSVRYGKQLWITVTPLLGGHPTERTPLNYGEFYWIPPKLEITPQVISMKLRKYSAGFFGGGVAHPVQGEVTLSGVGPPSPGGGGGEGRRSQCPWMGNPLRESHPPREVRWLMDHHPALPSTVKMVKLFPFGWQIHRLPKRCVTAPVHVRITIVCTLNNTLSTCQCGQHKQFLFNSRFLSRVISGLKVRSHWTVGQAKVKGKSQSAKFRVVSLPLCEVADDIYGEHRFIVSQSLDVNDAKTKTNYVAKY